jgi:hypothetical protein
MDKDNLPGLSPLWLILLATLLAALLPLMVPAVLGTDPVKAADWIGFSGSILTTGVAGAAIYYAWKGIIRQLRISLISREEDRIERELPGLRDANDRLRKIRARLSSTPPGSEEILASFNLGKSTWSIVQEIEQAFPFTDDRTRRRLAELFSNYLPALSQAEVVYGRWIEAENRKHHIKDFDPSTHEEIIENAQYLSGDWERRVNHLHAIREELEQFNAEISERVQILERTLPRFRAEIEGFFNR